MSLCQKKVNFTISKKEKENVTTNNFMNFFFAFPIFFFKRFLKYIFESKQEYYYNNEHVVLLRIAKYKLFAITHKELKLTLLLCVM